MNKTVKYLLPATTIDMGGFPVKQALPTQRVSGEQQETIQLWINSPASKKMIPPSYHYLSKANIPVFFSDDALIENKLIAGQYKQQRGQINTQSELLIIWGIAQAGSEQTLDIPSNHNAMIYPIFYPPA